MSATSLHRFLSCRLAAFVGALVVSTVFAPAPAAAQASKAVTRIEQDWTIVVGNPDPTSGMPQLALRLKPDPAVNVGGLLLLNYVDQPSFSTGGTQLQLWNGATCLAYQTNGSQTLGKQVSERITFTLFMEVDGTNLTFGFTNMKSWSFGNNNNQTLTTPSTTTSLPNYATSDTASKSVILVGSEQVSSMTINAVRYYSGKSLVATDTSTNVFP
ncbi:MAG TPA: hypothetical protein VH120_04790 [Gemmataceae bacterium]|nr:hypothetical protein [Gemmataceae bacterium]